MAQKLYELALEIQGKLDSSFSGAMKSAQGDIKALESDMKAWQDRQKKVSGIDASYIKAREGARQLGAELLNLKGKQKAVSDYQAQYKATTETARAYRNVQREVRALTAAYAKDKTPANKKAMQEAAKQARALEKEYNKNKTALTKMGEKLKSAGINTKDLGNEQATLARKIADATKEQEQYNRAAERVTRHKAFWADLTGKVREYSGYALRAAKWTAGIGATLATSAYMITKSTAEAGDKAAKLGKKINETAEHVQELQIAAKWSGVENFDTAMQTMMKNVSNAATKLKREGKDTDAFKILKIAPRVAAKNGALWTLECIAEQLKTLKNYERESVLNAIFTKQRGGIKEMLAGGVTGLDDLRERARRTGNIISEELTGKSESFLDNITELQESIAGLKTTIGSDLMPVVDDIVKKITEWVQENRKLISSEVKEWAEWLIENLPYAWEEFKKGTSAVSDFIKIIGGGIETLGGFSETLKILLGLWTAKKVYGMVSWISGAAGSLFPAAGTATAAGTAGSALAGGAATTATTAAAGTTSAAAAGTATTAAASGGVLSALSTALMNLPLAGILGGTAYLALTTPEEAKKQALAEAGDFGLTPSWMREERPKTDAFVDAMMKLAEQRQISVSREDIQNEQGRLTANLQGQTTSRWFMSDEVSRLLDAALEERASLLPMFDELNEQAKLDVKREDVAQYSVQLMECVRGNEQAIRDLPERLRPILEVLRPVQSAIVEHHARGGFISTPTVSTLAERGGEMVVPTADADRGLGLSRLFDAARKLNVPILRKEEDEPAPRWNLSRPLRFESSGGAGRSSGAPLSFNPGNINFSPTIYVTVSEGGEVAEQIDTTLRQSFDEIIQDYFDEMRRVAYAT